VQEAIILNVLELDGITPKNHSMWSMKVRYNPKYIIKGYSAFLQHVNDCKYCIKTSGIHNIEEDKNNLILYTRNSIYKIKKFINLKEE